MAKASPTRSMAAFSSHTPKETSAVSPTTDPIKGSVQQRAQAAMLAMPNQLLFKVFMCFFSYLGKGKPWSIVHGQEKNQKNFRKDVNRGIS